jgi:predicted unusual protein kinase regulating ubiquinone biosynthesis (AarF/ABC1/UbiB family)
LTAAALDEEVTGNARATTFEFEPIVRMTSTFIGGGEDTFESLLQGAEGGIYIPDYFHGSGMSTFTIAPSRAYRIRDGKIVWIDMGMMGRMSEHDRALLRQAVEGIATNDIGEIQDAVMALGKFRGKPDPARLYDDLAMFMAQYGKMEMKEIDIARILMELMEIMKKNHMSMPHGLTLLVRGLTQVEGVLAEISPEIMNARAIVPPRKDPRT